MTNVQACEWCGRENGVYHVDLPPRFWFVCGYCRRRWDARLDVILRSEFIRITSEVMPPESPFTKEELKKLQDSPHKAPDHDSSEKRTS
jgi:hypothetical protein